MHKLSNNDLIFFLRVVPHILQKSDVCYPLGSHILSATHNLVESCKHMSPRSPDLQISFWALGLTSSWHDRDLGRSSQNTWSTTCSTTKGYGLIYHSDTCCQTKKISLSSNSIFKTFLNSQTQPKGCLWRDMKFWKVLSISNEIKP